MFSTSELIQLLLIILFVYLCVYGVVNRIRKCTEFCAYCKTLKDEQSKQSEK